MAGLFDFLGGGLNAAVPYGGGLFGRLADTFPSAVNATFGFDPTKLDYNKIGNLLQGIDTNPAGTISGLLPPPTFNDRFAPATNSPLQAPPLPAPQNVAALPQGGINVPQGDIATPPLAKPVAFTNPQQPPAASAPLQDQNPGFLDRLAAAGDNLALAPSFIGGLAHAAQGMQSGKRIDAKMQLISDFLGNQSPYWVNPINQTINPATIGGGAGQGSSIGINTPELQAAMTMPQQINPQTGRDENFIKSLGPVLGAQVESALNGDSKLDGRMLQKIQPLAARAEPGWTQQTYQQRLQGMKDFYSGGKSAIIGQALNQSAGHFRELVDQMPGLPGMQMPLANWAKNTFDTQFRGKATANNFIINAHALADELSRIFKQTNMSDTEIRAWESKLTPDMSQEQQQGMVRTLYGLYDEAFQALEKKRQDSLGPAVAGKMAPLIGGHTQANLDRVKQFGIGTPQGAQPGVTSTGVKWSIQ